jgi:hypothetical protein
MVLADDKSQQNCINEVHANSKKEDWGIAKLEGSEYDPSCESSIPNTCKNQGHDTLIQRKGGIAMKNSFVHQNSNSKQDSYVSSSSNEQIGDNLQRVTVRYNGENIGENDTPYILPNEGIRFQPRVRHTSSSSRLNSHMGTSGDQMVEPTGDGIRLPQSKALELGLASIQQCADVTPDRFHASAVDGGGTSIDDLITNLLNSAETAFLNSNSPEKQYHAPGSIVPITDDTSLQSLEVIDTHRNVTGDPEIPLSRRKPRQLPRYTTPSLKKQ